MSERDKDDNARRKGRKAYWAGVPLAHNPMIASDSRMNWERAWREEEEWDRKRRDTEARHDSGDRHAHKDKWYTMVDFE